MDVRPKHLLKQLLPKYVTPRGILMDVRFRQLKKQLLPKELTILVRVNVMDVRLKLSLKQKSPKEVTLSPIDTLFNGIVDKYEDDVNVSSVL
jgi:hypothetical protein